MNVARKIEEVRSLVGPARRSGKLIGLVPTMGAMHCGHFSLIEAARADCDFVVVSIFVNPTQFAPNEDLTKYPRRFEQDLTGCRDRGVDVVFAPETETMYPDEPLTEVRVKRLSETLCGRSRPTHFTGMATVVTKLFNIVQPDRAYFGAKDFQQAVIIRRMVHDLNFPLEIVVCPTVREENGLAMSSRNERLSADQRRQAAGLAGALRAGEEIIRRKHPPAGEAIAAIRANLAEHAPDGVIDYVQIVDQEDLADVENTSERVLIVLAVRFGGVRLIDNLLVEKGQAPELPQQPAPGR